MSGRLTRRDSPCPARPVFRMSNQEIKIVKAPARDAEEILALQKLAYISEAKLYNDYDIPPLRQTLAEILDDFKNYIVLKAVSGKVIVGSVRGQINDEGACYIGRLMVHPDFQKRGIGSRLLAAIEAVFPKVPKYTLGTGQESVDNLRLYQKLGYTPVNTERMSEAVVIVFLEKANPAKA
jgi:ribosomal protein S18 acetylase RimI-like enzyme